MEKQRLKNIKQNKGITLIALVITIVVMLLLVAVTISMAINGGLFDYAGKATGETQNAIDAEQQLANLEGNLTVDQLIDKYTNSQEKNKKLSEVVAVGDLVAYDHGDAVVNLESQYGQYISGIRGEDDIITYTLNAAEYDGGWKVVHLGENGSVYLMSSNRVSGKLIFLGASTSVDAVLEAVDGTFFTDFCSVYVNSDFAEQGFTFSNNLGWTSALDTFSAHWNGKSFLFDEVVAVYEASIDYDIGLLGWKETSTGLTVLKYSDSAANVLHEPRTNSGFVYPIIELKDNLTTTGKNALGEWVIISNEG